MVSIFDDGEPIDPKKLQDLQTQITDLKEQSSLTSERVVGLSSSIQKVVFHSKSGSVNIDGLKAGLNPLVDISLDWETEYLDSDIFTVVTARLSNPELTNIRYSLTGENRAPKLAVWAALAKSGKISFHWVSVAKKTIKI